MCFALIFLFDWVRKKNKLLTQLPIGSLNMYRHVIVYNVRLCVQSTDSGCHYNIQLVNALVLYVGTQAIQHVNSKGQSPSMNTIAPSTHMDIFQNLAVNLDTEGESGCRIRECSKETSAAVSVQLCLCVCVCVYELRVRQT